MEDGSALGRAGCSGAPEGRRGVGRCPVWRLATRHSHCSHGRRSVPRIPQHMHHGRVAAIRRLCQHEPGHAVTGGLRPKFATGSNQTVHQRCSGLWKGYCQSQRDLMALAAQTPAAWRDLRSNKLLEEGHVVVASTRKFRRSRYSSPSGKHRETGSRSITGSQHFRASRSCSARSGSRWQHCEYSGYTVGLTDSRIGLFAAESRRPYQRAPIVSPLWAPTLIPCMAEAAKLPQLPAAPPASFRLICPLSISNWRPSTRR